MFSGIDTKNERHTSHYKQNFGIFIFESIILNFLGFTNEMKEDVRKHNFENHLKKNDLKWYSENYVKYKDTMRK